MRWFATDGLQLFRFASWQARHKSGLKTLSHSDAVAHLAIEKGLNRAEAEAILEKIPEVK